MQTQAQAQQAQAKNISEQIKQERQRQQNILESQMSNEPSLVSEVGDAASSLASAMGSAASSLLLSPIKGTARFIKESLTSPSVKSSDVFPQSKSLFSSDVFSQSKKPLSSSSLGMFSQQSSSFPQSQQLSSSVILPQSQSMPSPLYPLSQQSFTYSPQEYVWIFRKS